MLRSAIVLAVLLASSPALALDAACGLTVPAGETAVLQSDLTCSERVALQLENGATLDLNGFTLTVATPNAVGVTCTNASCSIVSTAAVPGVIDGGLLGGWAIIPNLDSTVAPMTRKLIIDNVAISNFLQNGMYGAFAGKNLLSRLSVTGCGGAGINGKNLVLTGVTVTGNGWDPQQTGDGIHGRDVQGTNVTVSDNGAADVVGRRVKIRGLTATDNEEAGIDADAAFIRDGQLSGNGTLDVTSLRRPRLRDTTCEHSNWGVCALDP